MKKKYLLHSVIILLLTVIDQLTKIYARNVIKAKSQVLIPNVLSFTYLENRGSVWGILQGRINFLLIVSIILFIVLIYVYIKIPNERLYRPLIIMDVIMCAGAIGNTIDRIVFGYVTDFIYFELINFPIFNVADCYISVCAVLTVILVLTKYRDDNFTFLSFKKNTVKEVNEKELDTITEKDETTLTEDKNETDQV